ncbi:MAG TPA: hypothetical protein PKZ16_01780 [bacterium]|nr:hypothetical protein [bacterium]HPL95515.1 hypothetical protein [bacterium]
MEDMLVVGSKVKAYVKGKNLHMAGDLAEALSKEVAHMLDKAAKRCEDNKRSTIRPADL